MNKEYIICLKGCFQNIRGNIQSVSDYYCYMLFYVKTSMTSSNSHLFHVHSTFYILSTANDICIYKDQEPFSSILDIYDNLLKVTEFHN